MNIITHLLSKVHYKAARHEDVKLPKRQEAGKYKEPNYPYKYVKETF